MDDFKNSYEDAFCAESYAKLEFPGTYYLAYRDLPELISKYVKGNRALDFGCGTGRSTRFLHELGFYATGIDISVRMIEKARQTDPFGDYRLVPDGDLSRIQETFNLVLSAFTFDNIPTAEHKTKIFSQLNTLLASGGMLINLVSDPCIYKHEWASFSTKDFPENKQAVSGDRVKIIITDSDDKTPVKDVVCSDTDYRNMYDKSGLRVVQLHHPLAKKEEPFEWVHETKISPWSVYVLQKS